MKGTSTWFGRSNLSRKLKIKSIDSTMAIINHRLIHYCFIMSDTWIKPLTIMNKPIKNIRPNRLIVII